MMRRKQRANGRGSLIRRKSDGPWHAVYFDESRRRVFRSTETTSKEAARDLLDKWTKEVRAIRREIATNPNGASATRAATLPLVRHLADYLRWCRSMLAPRNVELKRLHLRVLRNALPKGAPLSTFTLEAVERVIAARDAARTQNSYRQTYHALAEFLIARDRLEKNPVSRIEKRNEAADRRLVRRPFTEDELRALLAVATTRQNKGAPRWSQRGVVYLLAVHTALRRSELRALTWGDVDLDAATLRVRAAVAKSRKEATIHLHPEAVEALRAFRALVAGAVLPMVRVFATMPGAKTFNRDLQRAKIPKEDAQGRVVDLHALRMTAATELCSRSTPAVAQRALRHASSTTTLRHYVSIEDSAVATAIDSRAWLTKPTAKPRASSEAATATGTDGVQQQWRQQSEGREGVRAGSDGCETARSVVAETGSSANRANLVNLSGKAGARGPMRDGARVEVVGVEGLEPSTPSLSSWCSSQLS